MRDMIKYRIVATMLHYNQWKHQTKMITKIGMLSVLLPDNSISLIIKQYFRASNSIDCLDKIVILEI